MEATAIQDRVDAVRKAFNAGKTRPLEWRREQLRNLQKLLRLHEAKLMQALQDDLGKPAVEAYAGEIGFVAGEVKHTIKNLDRWVRSERVSTPLHSQPGRSAIECEPLGVVLIIAPWNYPLQLLLSPLVGALAAGNCAVLKPSELTPHMSTLLAELIPQCMDPEAVTVIEGGIPETTALLEQRFDHIFFTGSGPVGKIVMNAAAKHLTPVTLELGGKSPCVVDEQVNLTVAARRIAWGKFFNAGQTCVAPDYVLVHKAQEQPLLAALQSTVREFYGADPETSPHFARIVNARHHERLQGLLEGAGEVVMGGTHDVESRYFAPTIVSKVPLEAKVMQEEIFGPILPVIPVGGIDEAIAFVNERPKPLALYMFSSNHRNAEAVLARTSSGGACVNDTIAHLAVPGLPFGGVGASGFGEYHGRHSFKTFSHRKAVLRRSTRFDVQIRYPPYGDLKWIRKLIG